MKLKLPEKNTRWMRADGTIVTVIWVEPRPNWFNRLIDPQTPHIQIEPPVVTETSKCHRWWCLKDFHKTFIQII